MKSKYLASIICLVFIYLDYNQAYSGAITPREAVTAANYQLVKMGKQADYKLKEGKEIMNEGQVLAYAFDLDPAGYIVVAASTALPPVIAYSNGSSFGALEPGNPLYELIKADLSERFAHLNTSGNSIINENESRWEAILNNEYVSGSDPLFEQWPATGDGWLKTNWTQSAPYNNFCPMDPVTGLRSYAGCPATAMAQIMNFHETSNNTRFDDTDDYYHNYAGRQYWIDDDCDAVSFACFPALNTCLDTLEAHYKASVSLTAEDKAALTFACGVATRSVFTSQGSGTFGVDQAYDAYIRFGCSTVVLLDSTDADLYDRLKQNIKDTLPAHLAIVDESWSTGHNVVVDGYNTEEYYHLNFGWGGSYNGWYLLPQEIPYELTVIEGLVVDIMKKIPTGFDESAVGGQRTAVNVIPNPVRNDASVVYNLEERGPVRFTVYNASGQIILDNKYGDQMQGRYSVPVSFHGEPSGIYFYLLRTASGFSAGKMLKQ